MRGSNPFFVYTSLIYVISGRNVNFLAKKIKKSEIFSSVDFGADCVWRTDEVI